MKGQYLAVEGVITFAMGITLAIGTISAFSTYQDSVNSRTVDTEKEIIANKIKTSIYDLNNSYSGSKRLDLPEDLGGANYRISIDEKIRIIQSTEEFSTSISNFKNYEMEGAVEGGEVILSKTGNKYILRSD